MVVGYGIVLHLAEIGIPSPTWRLFIAAIGAIAASCSTGGRLVAPAPPGGYRIIANQSRATGANANPRHLRDVLQG